MTPPTTRIGTLDRIDVEHLVSENGRAAVKVRAVGELAVMVGEIDPVEARVMALHLVYASGRAEYEQDLVAALRASDAPTSVIAQLLNDVRAAEAVREGLGQQ